MVQAGKQHGSESFVAGALLAVAGGFLDAYTFILRGGVFANAQTGNIVQMGLQIAQLQWGRAFQFLVPIISFVLGVLLTEFMRVRLHRIARLHWTQLVLGVELLLLLVVMCLPFGNYNWLANVLVAFLCAMQVQGFRLVNGNPYASTMCTGNLRSAAEHVAFYLRNGNKAHLRTAAMYLGIITAFVLGAVGGYWLCNLWPRWCLLFCVLLLALVFVYITFTTQAGTKGGAL